MLVANFTPTKWYENSSFSTSLSALSIICRFLFSHFPIPSILQLGIPRPKRQAIHKAPEAEELTGLEPAWQSCHPFYCAKGTSSISTLREACSIKPPLEVRARQEWQWVINLSGGIMGAEEFFPSLFQVCLPLDSVPTDISVYLFRIC